MRPLNRAFWLNATWFELNHVLARPEMYFGFEPKEAAVSLAGFVNGFMSARTGFVYGSFCHTHNCVADPFKTLEENAADFRRKVEEYEAGKANV